MSSFLEHEVKSDWTLPQIPIENGLCVGDWSYYDDYDERER